MKLKNVAHRHNRAMRNQTVTPETSLYAIADSNHRPDLHGEFAGVKVERMDSRQVVRLTEQAARFYLDSGAIVPFEERPATPARRMPDQATK